MTPSSIDKLEAPIRAEINRLRIDKSYTIEQIVGHLKAMDIVVSKSAMGRHVQKIETVGAKIKEARAIAEGIAAQITDESKLSELNIELAHSAVMQLLSQAGEDGEAHLDAKETMFLAGALNDLARAQKTNADRILKVRKETAEKASKAAEKVAVKQGLSAETVAAIKHAVLGVAAG